MKLEKITSNCINSGNQCNFEVRKNKEVNFINRFSFSWKQDNGCLLIVFIRVLTSREALDQPFRIQLRDHLGGKYEGNLRKSSLSLANIALFSFIGNYFPFVSKWENDVINVLITFILNQSLLKNGPKNRLVETD